MLWDSAELLDVLNAGLESLYVALQEAGLLFAELDADGLDDGILGDDLGLLGDVRAKGCRLTDEQAERISGCDAIMAPAGGILTIEPYAAYEICVASGARVVLPMHYGGGGRGNRRLRPVDEFASLFGEGLVRRYETDRLELTAETPAQVAILTPPELHGRA